MKSTFNLLTIVLLFALLSGCSGVSITEHEKLKAENEQLKKELEDIKYGADKLLASAKLLIADKKFDEAKTNLDSLLSKHPGSEQASSAKKLIASIQESIEEIERVEKNRLANATKLMRTSYDDVNEITWYYDRTTPKYTDSKSIHLYIGKKKDETPWLRFRIQYAADDWLFMNSFIIKTDDKPYTISTSYGEVETDHDGGEIWEWYDVGMTNTLYEICKSIISSKSPKLRYNGRQYYKDKSITAQEKQAIQNVLNAYEALGGKLIF